MDANLAIWIAGSLILFFIGIYGLISQKDAIKTIISIEILLISANMVLIGMGFVGRTQGVDPLSQSYALISQAIGGGIIGLGLTMLAMIYKKNGSVNLAKLAKLRW